VPPVRVEPGEELRAGAPVAGDGQEWTRSGDGAEGGVVLGGGDLAHGRCDVQGRIERQQ
jgi:hypothetical protein